MTTSPSPNPINQQLSLTEQVSITTFAFTLRPHGWGERKCRSLLLAISSYSNYSLIKSLGGPDMSRPQRTPLAIVRTFMLPNLITSENQLFLLPLLSSLCSAVISDVFFYVLEFLRIDQRYFFCLQGDNYFSFHNRNFLNPERYRADNISDDRK